MDDSLSPQKWDRVPLQNLLWSYSNIKTPWQHIVYLFSCLSQWSGLSLCCIKSPAYQQKKKLIVACPLKLYQYIWHIQYYYWPSLFKKCTVLSIHLNTHLQELSKLIYDSQYSLILHNFDLSIKCILKMSTLKIN